MVTELRCGCCWWLDGISYWRQLNSLHSRENGEGKGVVVVEGGLVVVVVGLVGVGDDIGGRELMGWGWWLNCGVSVAANGWHFIFEAAKQPAQ